MPKLSPDKKSELLDVLLELPTTANAAQRAALLFNLPPQIANSVDLTGSRDATLANLIETLEYWGQLTDGRWATEVMLRNALRTARNTQLEQRLEVIRQSFELSAGTLQVPELPERIASETSHLMPVGFLDAGHRASRAVARMCVPQYVNGKQIMNGKRPRLGVGTGWVCAPGLLITNHHVMAARFAGDPAATVQDIEMQAHGAQAWFDYVDVDGEHAEYGIRKLEAISPALDYALLRLEDRSAPGGIALGEWGFLQLKTEAHELHPGMPLNVIQHPGGDPKQIAIRRNDYIGPADADRFYYLTDTLPGSSGSPVFDDDWKVVGLHRGSRALPEKVYLNGETIKYNNVGVRIHAIIGDLPPALREEIASAQQGRH